MISFGTAREVSDRYLQLELEERNIAQQKRLVQAVDEISGNLASDPEKDLASINEDFTDKGLAKPLMPSKTSWRLGAENFEKKSALNRVGNGDARFLNFQMLKADQLSDSFDFDDEVVLRQAVRFHKTLSNVNVCYKIRTPQGTDVIFGDSRLHDQLRWKYVGDCLYVIEWRFRLKLMHGKYCVMGGLTQPPTDLGHDWTFIDMVPFGYDFNMAPRQKGMIDGLVAWNDTLAIALCDDGGMLDQR
jgi:hypothetical protein